MTSRIVLDESTRAIVDQIQAVTKSPSPSHAIAMMVSRYGKHLLLTWELDPERYGDPNPLAYQNSQPLTSESRTVQDQQFKFDEPLSF
ncbi:hypothetical protein [Leptolyngbya sp. NIES-2104]|uniref:hypothetical protein n=1 Tax=Leptolyngbya sp. NIES-2104 TaxID=1552121 RepID=UPI0006ECC686|nr:hypothetical protein [Leptolyngbya sp. NIES-2104]GAQ00125.1 hypothetical protein NIES2104_66900 [Leptolyngbya sp. NIES-2104]